MRPWSSSRSGRATAWGCGRNARSTGKKRARAASSTPSRRTFRRAAAMALITVESLRQHDYGGVPRPEGTRYEAEESLIETLEGLGRARRGAGEPETPPPPAPTTPP